MTQEDAILKLECDVSQIKVDVVQIKNAVIGEVGNNDKIGLKGQVALVKQSLGRAWWAISILIGTVIGSAVWIIRSGLS